MVLSRIWVFALSLATAAAAGAAMLAQGIVNRQYREGLEDALRRDRLEVEQILKLDARARIDAIGPIAAHPDVRTALRQASDRRDDGALRELNATLRPKLLDLNRQLAGLSGELVFALDTQGTIIAQLGPNEAKYGSSIVTFPLVERALAGYVRDDVWVYDGAVYRMAARPVIDSGRYVGAIVHGKRLDAGLAELLSKRLNGASVAFFSRDAILAAYQPADVPGAPGQAEMGAALTASMAQPAVREKLDAGERTDALDVAGRGRMVLSLVTGSAAESMVGYALARPLEQLGGPMALFENATEEDFGALPRPLLGGAAAGFFVLGMLFFFLEKDRPFGKLKRATRALADRKQDRLSIAEFGGGYRRIAESVNEALDKVAEAAGAAGPTRKADLDKILGPTPGAGQASSFFGFQQADPGADAGIPSIPPAPGPSPIAGAAKAPPAAKPTPGPAFASPPAAPPASPAPAARPAAPPPPSASAARPGAPAAPVPAAPAPAAAPSAAFGDDDEGDGATMVARVPDSLLTASATGQVGALDAAKAEEELHFRQVYEEFVKTKRECGEPIAGFTYDKFVVTLRKNKESILSRHGAKGVRFTVYVKDGKAALKATPVKE
jgi:hypothetical protein